MTICLKRMKKHQMRKHNRKPFILQNCPDNLESMMEYLKLHVSLQNYRQLLDTAGKENLSHEEFLRRLLSDESSAKFEQQAANRIAKSKLPSVKTIEEFDFNFPTKIPKQKILHAVGLSFLENAEGLVFI